MRPDPGALLSAPSCEEDQMGGLLRMDLMTVVTGMLSGARGCCPVCGHDVARTHAFNGARLQDRYACYRCGPTTYQVTA